MRAAGRACRSERRAPAAVFLMSEVPWRFLRGRDPYSGVSYERGTPVRDSPNRLAAVNACSGIGFLLPNNQRQHRTLHIQEDVLTYDFC